MAKAKVSDQEFMRLFADLQSPAKVARAIGINETNIHQRRRRLEKRYDVLMPVADPRSPASIRHDKAVAACGIQDGVILVGSDAHYWPGPATTAHRAFVKFCKELKPSVVVMNGDAFDAASISRFPSIGWEDRPALKDELKACQDRLQEIVSAAPKARRYWPAGNHDLRFESRLAMVAQEYKGIAGIHLKDHFPEWTPCWRLDVNDDLIIRHREYGGIHAVYNNVLRSGKSMVTGHLHSMKVTPWTNYTGTNYGVDGGCLADGSDDPQFVNYLEARAPNWRSGFVVLTFHKGRLLWPELVHKWAEGEVEFRGRVIRV